MILYTSSEDYLETILVLEKEINEVHSIDIANKTGFTKPSVSGAMKNLKADGYITMGSDHVIRLTEEGRRIAERVYERHVFFIKVLTGIGVDEETAEQDACRMEHAISQESFDKMKAAWGDK